MSVSALYIYTTLTLHPPLISPPAEVDVTHHMTLQLMDAHQSPLRRAFLELADIPSPPTDSDTDGAYQYMPYTHRLSIHTTVCQHYSHSQLQAK